MAQGNFAESNVVQTEPLYGSLNQRTFFPGLKFVRENMWFHYRVINLENVTASPTGAEHVAQKAMLRGRPEYKEC